MSRRTSFALACLLAALAASQPLAASAEPTTRVLAPNGDIYAVTQGSYGELFPGGAEALPRDPVLAITVIRPDGSSQRLLVPETSGPAAEELSSLLLGPDGTSLHVLWQSSAPGSPLRVASLGADGWGEVIDVSRAVGVLRGSLRAAATRDRVEIPGEGADAAPGFGRSVLHVVWLEGQDGAVIYTPLVFEDGVYIGSHALYALDRLVAAVREPGSAPADPVEDHVELAPTVEAGSEGGAVVAAFTDPENGGFVAVELRMVAGVLSVVGTRLREGILDLASQLEPGSPDSLEALARGARTHLIQVGGRLQPELLQFLAGEIESFILEHGFDWAFQPEAMAERTRAELLALGASFDHAPVEQMDGGARPQLINVGQRSEGPIPSHDLRLRVTAERQAPDVPEGVAATTFLSGDGEDALVAWQREGVVYFRESDESSENGWGPAVRLGITGEDPALVRDLLRARVRGR